MFESLISAGAIEKLPRNVNANAIAWSYDMQGHAKEHVERYCELANKNIEQLYKVSTPCIDDRQLKTDEMKTMGVMSKVCSRTVLKL